ncbi:SRP40, C-terminal domain [Teratosphaeria destructans]|uniref:SRP40, C-terminal domain n=1 Tax=Teratosphaeria destructans TaxID=418781 RepID=A0A9W7W411_9PEZI|nr:SRP40, C-terminal domain [Teratosphaeria destructans]
MAKSKSSKIATIPTSLWTNGDLPAPGLNDVLSQLAHFFEKLGYSSTLAALTAEAKKNGVEIDTAEWERGIGQEHSAPLLELWEQWYQSNDGFPMLPVLSAAQKQIKENEEGDSSSESDSSEGREEDDDESGNSESESESDSEDETEGHKAGAVDDEAESSDDDSSDEESDEGEEEAKPAGSNKRKREDTPESSSASGSEDSSDDDSSSDASDAPQAKRVKTQQVDGSDEESNDSSEASDSDSTSDSDSDSDRDSSSAASGTSESGDDSSSASDSDSEDGADSDSSDSDSDSSESSAPPPPKKKGKKEAPKPERGGSTSSSATLDHEPAPVPASVKAEKKSKKTKPIAAEQPTEDLLVPASAAPEVAPEDPHAGIHPDRLARLPSSNTEKFTRIPATKENVKAMKKENVPFSRIPRDTYVDPKFASNAYVPYDYAQKAHEDLIVTKGKGFTKEKNKKKRGSYRGGAIDLTPKGIKFED